MKGIPIENNLICNIISQTDPPSLWGIQPTSHSF